MSFDAAPPWKHLANDTFRAMLTVLRERTAPILANNLLPHFTDHSVAHSDSVARLVDDLIESGTTTLTDQELVILYSACYLHDIGMQFERAGETEVISSLNLLPAWDRQSISNKRDLLRAHHHRISAELVRKSVNSATPPIGIQLKSAYSPSYIACLCHAHCIPTDTSEYAELFPDGPVRLGLLSAILRLADILDESRRRATREKARTLELNNLP